MKYTDIIASPRYSGEALHYLDGIGISQEKIESDNRELGWLIDLDTDICDANSDSLVWLYCLTLDRLIRQVADVKYLNWVLYDWAARVQTWSESANDPAALCALVEGMQTLQIEICRNYSVACRHITSSLIWMTGSGVPVQKIARFMMNVKYGYHDMQLTCALAKKIILQDELISDQDRAICSINESTVGKPIDPLCVFLAAMEYDPYIRDLPWYGFDEEPFLIFGLTGSLTEIMSRFDAEARMRIIHEIKGG